MRENHEPNGEIISNQMNNAQNNSIISGEYESIDEADESQNDPEYEPETTVVVDTQNRPATRSTTGLNPLNLLNFEFFAEPATVREAMASSDSTKWKEAMQNEMDSLMENNTWTLVNIPRDRKLLKTKWVFTTK